MMNTILTWVIVITLIVIAITLIVVANILSELVSCQKWKPAYDTQIHLLHKSYAELHKRIREVEKKVDTEKCLLGVRLTNRR